MECRREGLWHLSLRLWSQPYHSIVQWAATAAATMHATDANPKTTESRYVRTIFLSMFPSKEGQCSTPTIIPGVTFR